MFSSTSLLLISAAASFVVAEPSLSVNTKLGAVNGVECATSGSKAFLSIPFANPPTGSLRFAPPQLYNGSYPTGGLDATTSPPYCIQFGTEFIEPLPWSEDWYVYSNSSLLDLIPSCSLFLNIWAPANATSSSKLPVKFWVYGGTDNAGGISDPLYNGCNIATDSIVVSAAYRLGVLGFLSLDTAGIPGNMGFQDIELALRWVQDNVAAFGGDPVSQSELIYRNCNG
jgi:carboxylesterase type B